MIESMNEKKIPIKSLSIFNRKYQFQLLAAITVELVTLFHGLAIGWISPSLFKLQSPDSPTGFTITVEDISWIGSVYGFGSLLGNITFGLMVNRFGRKFCIYMLALPYISMLLLIYFAKNYIYLCVARFLNGITGGGNYVIVPLFTSEISEPSVRGALTSMAMLFYCAGVLLANIMTTYLDFYLNIIIMGIFPIVYLIATIFFPETPQYLLMLGKIDEARESYYFYQNVPKKGTVDTADSEAFQQMQDHILKPDQQRKVTLHDFFNREALVAFAMCFVLIFTNQFSGSFTVVNYMYDIFLESGIQIDPNLCTIIMGVVQIVGICSSMAIVDRLGRKSILLCSTGGTAIGYVAVGCYMNYATTAFRQQYNWMPLLIMGFVLYTTSLGIVALLFTVIMEVLPGKIRNAGNSISMGMLSCMVFITLKLFPIGLHMYGLANIMFGFAAVSIFGFSYILLQLKETKGKTLT